MAAPRTEPIAKSQPDKVVKHEKVQVRMYEINKRIIGYGVCEPGWRWSTHVKPHTGGDVCQCEHTGFVLRGRMVCQWKDGRTLTATQQEYVAGQAYYMPPGHDAWVVGNEPVELLDFTGMAGWGERSSERPAVA